jgi:hypothetical protein
MSALTMAAIDASSDEELLAVLGKELQARVSAEQGSPEFVAKIRELPVGLRAMAATYELDVSFALDDLGWHFGNWCNKELAQETEQGLKELGMEEVAALFGRAFDVAKKHGSELANDNWMEWYHGSEFEKEVRPFDKQARELLDRKGDIFKHWVRYTRRYPDRVGAAET